MKPNIFNYATNELSQDAFLLWLLQWANSEYSNFTERHNASKAIVEKILSKMDSTYTKPIEKVKVYKQWEKIDVSFTVNDEIYVIIEDKTNSHQHSNQLTRYKETAKKWCDDNNYELLCIYYKSGNENIKSIKDVEGAGFKVLSRAEMIAVLSIYSPQSDFYNDYYEYLSDIESETNSFRVKNWPQWGARAWEGFYLFLQSKFDGDWHYVANPAGGFIGFWWAFTKRSSCKIYLQIEQGDLCIKISEANSDRSGIRNKMSEYIIRKAQELNYIEVVKPSRLGSGEYMTIAKIAGDAYLNDIDNIQVVLKKYVELIAM